MILAIRMLASRLRLKPYDTQCAHGREKERYRLAIWSALANYLSTGIGMLVLLASVPLTLPYLGKERFGIWMTVASFAGLLSFLDLGVGNSLINRVSKAYAAGDHVRLRFTITHGLLVLAVIGLGVFALLISTVFFFDPSSLMRIEEHGLAVEAQDTLVMFSALFSISMPLMGIQRIFQGLQRGYWPYAFRFVGGLLSLALLFVAANFGLGPPQLLLVCYGLPLFFLVFLVGILVKDGLLSIQSLKVYKLKGETISLLRTGGLFFILQIGVMVGWGADSLLISSYVGVAAVTQFALVQRVFQFVTIPLAILNSPLWPSYAEARQNKDSAYIVKTLRRSLGFTFILSLLGGSVIFFISPWLFPFWTKYTVQISPNFVALFGFWAVLEASGNCFAMFLNGVEIIKEQVLSVIFFCVIAIPLKISLTDQFGIPGVLYAAIVSYMLAVVLPYSVFFRKKIQSSLNI